MMMHFKWRRDECALFWHVVKTTMSCHGAKMLMVMVLVSYALTSLSPYLNGQFVDMLVYGQDMHSIYILAFAIALLGIISAVFSYSLIGNFIRTLPIFIRTCTDEYGNPIL